MDLHPVSIPFLALYAETHFRFFRLFPSLLFKKEPELYFDTPKRLEPGKEMPVMLICNDIDRFPVEISDVTISLSQQGSTRIVLKEPDPQKYLLDHPFHKSCSVYLFSLAANLFTPGRFSINGTVTIRRGSKKSVIINDNLYTSSKLSFTGVIATDHLPGHEYCLYGDLHTHSQYSRSHVEFGPPLRIIDEMAAASGLSFCGITDHSYDLACCIDDYLKIDPDITLWHTQMNELRFGANARKTVIIPGEEISTRNKKNCIIHLGALGISRYIPGSRDGARRHPKKALQNELDCAQAIHTIEKQGGISFAAHPGARSGILQRIFLKRGTWSSEDISANLNAFQAVNNGFSPSWYRSRKLWISGLLMGRKLPLIAGNDAHGDFNRYRAISVPFLSIYENQGRYFGFARTGIYSTNSSEKSILDAVKNGRTFITTGPFLGISSTESPADILISHDTLKPGKNELYCHGISTPEFGLPRILNIFRGYYNLNKEKLLRSISYTAGNYRVCEKIAPDPENGEGYLRAELVCIKDDGMEFRAVTSPCYFAK